MLDPGKSVSHLPLAILQVRGRVTTPKQPKLFNIMLGQALVAPKGKNLFTPKINYKKVHATTGEWNAAISSELFEFYFNIDPNAN